jgi:hypothetical protein
MDGPRAVDLVMTAYQIHTIHLDDGSHGVHVIHGSVWIPPKPLGWIFSGYPSTIQLDGFWTMDQSRTLSRISPEVHHYARRHRTRRPPSWRMYSNNYLFGMTENRVPQSSNHTIVVIFHASIRISFSSKHQLSSPC